MIQCSVRACQCDGAGHATVRAAIAAGEPAISEDTKKKELVGDSKNSGRELRTQGDPEPVQVHDLKIPELGKVAPYGAYDIAANHDWVSAGLSADTGAFAAERGSGAVLMVGDWQVAVGSAKGPFGLQGVSRLTIHTCHS